jgi:hypothetical protein
MRGQPIAARLIRALGFYNLHGSKLMSTEIVVAIISGVAGLAGGVIAWIQAVKINRLKAEADSTLERIKAETNLALETMKVESESRRKAFELGTAESKPIEDAISQAWRDIQTIKELITTLLAPARYDIDLALKVFKPAYTSLVEGYSQWGSSLPDSARESWHAAKGILAFIDFTLPNQKGENPNNLDLSPQISERLYEIRLLLTDHQMALSGSRQTIRDEAIHKVVEALYHHVTYLDR